jgi:hypothetical protein
MSREPPMEWDGRRSQASASEVEALRRVVEAAQLHRECVTCWGVASPLAAETLQALHAALDALPTASPPATSGVATDARRDQDVRDALDWCLNWLNVLASPEKVLANAEAAIRQRRDALQRDIDEYRTLPAAPSPAVGDVVAWGDLDGSVKWLQPGYILQGSWRRLGTVRLSLIPAVEEPK